MELNFNLLRKKLAEAPTHESVREKERNPYLLFSILEPLFSGAPIRISEIDLSAFTSEDLEELMNFLYSPGTEERALSSLCQKVMSCRAVSRSKAGFC